MNLIAITANTPVPQVDYIPGQLSVENVKSLEIFAIAPHTQKLPSRLTQPLTGLYSQLVSSFSYWLKQNIIKKANTQ